MPRTPSAAAVLGAIVLAGVLLSLGRQAGAQNEIDVSGDWEITLGGTLSGSCHAGAVQRSDNLFLGGGCTLTTPLMLEGQIDRRTGELSVTGLGIAASGQASKNGDSMSGTWTAFGLSGTFTGTRVDVTPHFVDATGRWELRLGPGQPLAAGEAFSDACAAELRQSAVVLRAALDCDVSGEMALGGGIDPVEGEFYLLPLHGSEPPITQIHGTVTASGTMAGLFYAESAELSGPFDGTRLAGPLGDANCNETVNSIDASVILQLDAGLVASIACLSFADVTGEGSVNSVDAVLILQHEAGLLVSLPLRW